MAEAWGDIEIDMIVADYFAMLSDELAGHPFNKAQHNRALQALLNYPQRSQGSIEFKHQNISAVLLGLGQPWIDGYKPAANFQNARVDGVLRWLDARPDWLAPGSFAMGAAVGEKDAFTGSSRLIPDQPSLWIGPPPTQRNEPSPVDPEFMAANMTLPSAMPAIANWGRPVRNWSCITSDNPSYKLGVAILQTRSDGLQC